MTEASQPTRPAAPQRLDAKAVMNAVAAFCTPDRPESALLTKGFLRLTTSDDWASEISRLERLGLTARYIEAPLDDVLNTSGDLVLIRVSDKHFSLLLHKEQRWLSLNGDGDFLEAAFPPGNPSNIESVILNLPQAPGQVNGFASLTALWPKLRAAWAEVGIASLFINSGQLLLPVFALLIYDKIAMNGLFETLWALVFGMALYLLTDAGMRLIRSWMTERISVDQTLQGDERLWSRLVSQVDLPPGGFPRFLSNYRDLTLARDFVSSNYLLSIADIPFLLLYLGVIGFISWPLMVAAFVLIILFSITGYVLYLRQTRLSKEAEQRNTQKLAFMGETLNSLDVVRTTPGSGAFLRSWRMIAEETTVYETKRRLAVHQMGMLNTAVQTVTTVVILTCGVYLIHAQLLSIGKLIACNLLANRAMALVASLYNVIGKWQDFMRAAARMETSLETIDEQELTPRPQIEGHISILGIGKHYEGRPPALDNISFKVAPGERIALLGRPGAGKSTLLACLSGLCRPDTGQILIDGLALDHISRFDRIKWMAYKAQDPVVFAGTLEDNLRVSGCTDPERFTKAIWASGLENEFSSGRMSLGMALEERGSNLSGGQRQKVALARVFAQSANILLLDEPTLGLDPESERLLAERLPKLIEPSTVLIMTTHSPTMLEMVQRIVALDGGRIVADGPREKLVSLPSSKNAQNA